MKSNIENKNIFINKVFNQVFDKYDLMNDIMSFGTHRLWKKQLMNWQRKECEISVQTDVVAKQ